MFSFERKRIQYGNCGLTYTSFFLVKFNHKSAVKECINCSATTTSIMKILVQIENSHHLRNLVKHDDHSIYGTLDIVL